MIKIKNLSKSLGGHKVLDNLSLEIEKGQTVVIIGRSGCGKSVLLKHVIGLLKPDSGQVVIEGEDISRLTGRDLGRVRQKFGMLFQGAALFDSLSVRENVGFGLIEHSRIPEEEITKRVEEKLKLVGLSGILGLKPAELSGGMRKRVGLARAICLDPQIILYDEPTTGIDPIMADAINELIIDLSRKLKVTSICVTHDMVSAYKIADRIDMLYNGKIIESGTPEQVKQTTNPVVKQFILGQSHGPLTEGEKVGYTSQAL